jgi:hypothetical protein
MRKLKDPKNQVIKKKEVPPLGSLRSGDSPETPMLDFEIQLIANKERPTRLGGKASIYAAR